MKLFALMIAAVLVLLACTQKPNPHVVWPGGSDWDNVGMGDGGLDAKSD